MGILEARRKRKTRARNRAQIGIADQRQDGMVERRGGDFDLAARAEFAIHRQYTRQRFPLLAGDHFLLGQREIAALADESDQFRIARQQILIKPGHKMEDLEVAKILRRENLLAFLLVVQREITGVSGDEPVEVRLEEILQYKVALRFAQVFGARQGTVEKRIGRLAG